MDYCTIETAIGPLLLASDEAGLRLIGFQAGRHPMRPDPRWRERPDAFDEVVEQLTGYLAGRRRRFDLRLAPDGTSFQQRVWRALLDIPYGATISYAALAARIGQPTASRAVGLANGRNPLPIVIPCHRVIGADGTLTGYGGGLAIKERLLALESGWPIDPPSPAVRGQRGTSATATAALTRASAPGACISGRPVRRP